MVYSGDESKEDLKFVYLEFYYAFYSKLKTFEEKSLVVHTLISIC